MKESKQLIFEDEQLMPLMEKHLKDFSPYLQEVKQKYEDLEIDPFSEKIYKELIFVGVTVIKNRYEEKIKAEIKAAGIGSTLIRENLMNGAQDKVSELLKAVTSIKRFFPHISILETRSPLTIENISFLKGEFIISKEDEDRLMETKGRVYLKNEDETRLYNDLKGVITAFKQALNTLNDLNYYDSHSKESGVRLSWIDERFFIYKDGNCSIKPYAIGTAVNKGIENKVKKLPR
jgi:hypothetical protein